jgi:hypothetical protein
MAGPEMMPVFLPYAGIRAPRLGQELSVSPWGLTRPLCHPIRAVAVRRCIRLFAVSMSNGSMSTATLIVPHQCVLQTKRKKFTTKERYMVLRSRIQSFVHRDGYIGTGIPDSSKRSRRPRDREVRVYVRGGASSRHVRV